MCGIAGFLSPDPLKADATVALRAMTDALSRRGPDDDGMFVDAEVGIALGHRRLSILDLSPAGHQPMRSASGRYVLTYNGEIYNFSELRSSLEREGAAPRWRGASDTEVLLETIDRHGLAGALTRATGMFALALWDRQDRVLHLARDRLGEKPLYYGWQGRGANRRFLFASDGAALKRHPAFEGVTDPESIGLLLRYLYIPDPFSAWIGIRKLMPGTMLSVDARGAEEHHVYWSMMQTALDAKADPFRGTAQDAVSRLDRLLGDAVERQMVSDVPLGAFLSGGVDSSTVAALMQKRSSRPIKTFTIGFEEADFNEAHHASAVARHLGTDHTERLVTSQDAMAVIPQLTEAYTEPFADSSQIPTLIVSRLARETVTVSLSGDGGDELFGGYNRHLFAHRHWRKIAALPSGVRSVAGSGLARVSPQSWDRVLGKILQSRVAAFGDKMQKFSSAIGSQDVDDLYDVLTSVGGDPRRIMNRSLLRPPYSRSDRVAASRLPAAERMMVLDALQYLPGDVLTKVDRAAMFCSLETRVPLLDPAVVEFAWSLPLDMKIRDGTTKWALRQVLHRHVPKTLIDRPKMGFGLPVGSWLRKPLRDWAEALIAPTALDKGALFEKDEVSKIWNSHLSGERNREHELWPILMTQAWLAHNQK